MGLVSCFAPLSGKKLSIFFQSVLTLLLIFPASNFSAEVPGLLDFSFRPRFLNTTSSVGVSVVAIQPDGKILAGGIFSSVNETPHGNLVRLNTDGTVDTSFGPVTTDFAIGAMAIQPDGRILIGGTSIRVVNGVSRRFIARLHQDGTLDTSFNITETGSGLVRSIVPLPNGQILVSDLNFDWTDPGPVSNGRSGVIRLNSNGVVDRSFGPNRFTSDTNGVVESIVLLPDGRIIVGGSFSVVAGVQSQRLARLNSDGSADSTFTCTLDSNVNVVKLLEDGKMLIGGGFNTVNGVSRRSIARINANGSLDTFFNAGSGGGVGEQVRAIAVQPNGKVLIGGNLLTFNGQTRFGIARLNEDGTLDDTFRPTLTNENTALVAAVGSIAVQADEKIVAGGTFDFINGTPQKSMARFANKTPYDFDGDGKTDVGISRINGAQREWWYQRSTNNATFATAFGLAGDIIAPADFTGDGKTDIAQFRPSSGQWFVLRSEDNNFFGFSFGANGDIPAPADYDGDGKADAAVFRPSTGTWFVFRSSDNQVSFTSFGAAVDKPAVADFDGDGKADISIWKPDVGQWWRLNSSNSSLAAYQFGAVGDKPVQGDYTGDGKADVAIFRPSNNTWFVLRSEDLNFFAFPFGAAGDIPAPGDYDGDGRFDAAVFRPSQATWFVNQSTSGILIRAFGAASDQPIPGAFIP